MNRILRLTRGLAALAALAACLAVAGTANAQVKAWKISGAGVGPEGLPLPGEPARPHWAIGKATHLGKYYGTGALITATADFNPDGTITGTFGSAEPFVFVGADGDQLACDYGRDGDDYVGTFTLVPNDDGLWVAFWIAEFVPVPSECTGKFAGVEGSWTMYAMSEPFELGSSDPVGYVWAGKGKLKFKK